MKNIPVLFLFIILVGINLEALAEEEIDVIKSKPATKFQLSSEEYLKTQLNSSESAKNLVWIVKRNGHYFWKSREDRKLDHVAGGLYHYFIDPKGGGYVKVEHGLDGKIEFLEHVGIGMTTLTYFGKAAVFNP